MREHVAAVVVEYHSGGALSRCLESLRACDLDEIVVVDNGAAPTPASTGAKLLRMPRYAEEGPSKVAVDLPEPADPAHSASAASSPEVRWIRAPSNLGFGAGVNLGTAALEAELLLICNPDVEVSQVALEHLCATMEAFPSTAVVGPSLVDGSGQVVQSARAFPTIRRSSQQALLGIAHPSGRRSREYRERNWEAGDSGLVDWVTGACMLVRADAFHSIGGFDGRYFLYVEEVDLCWRMRSAGWQVRYEPSAKVGHAGAKSTSAHPYRAISAHHRSLWRFARLSSNGADRALLPLVGMGLAARCALAWAIQAARSPHNRPLPWSPRPREARSDAGRPTGTRPTS